MEKVIIKQVIEQMKTHNSFQFFEPIVLHIPDADNTLRSSMEYFIGNEFVWLPEYEHVATWLNNNEGRGLCLYGTNGTGKTILVQKVIPMLLFGYCRRIVRCFNYFDLNSFDDEKMKSRLLSIDDVGLENECVDFGNKRWVFPEIMDIAEKRNSVVIISSNLNGQGFIEKYGVRTFERIVATTKRIEFNHKSLRK
jgi:DNA replication protein DnaC